MLEEALESPLDCKEIKPVHPKGNLSWIFIGRTDAEAETPIFWPPDVKSRFIGKDPESTKDWRQEEKGTTEDEMVGWHHWLNGHEFEQTPGGSEEKESLACCSPCSRKESDMTEQLNSIPAGSTRCKKSACQCRRGKRCRLNPWVGKIPRRRKRKPAPVSLLGKFHKHRSRGATVHGPMESWNTDTGS